NNIFYILYNMDIRYHPKQDDPTPLETCDQMEISLLNVLNNLTSIHTRAKNIRFQIVGDFPVLHAFADYSVRMEYDDGIVQPLQENISSKILTK
ncbi:MAG: hypothetical protein Q8876_07915, partial [Bacillota bacterium]|nr:hypothetical protein [Bacillota bacterium]